MTLKNSLSALISTILLIVSITVVSTAHAAKPVYSGGRDRAAIRGYDPVSYFTQGKPIKGLKEFALEHKGAKWLFSSKGNLTLFKNNPDKYSPQYGGYCAYAVSRGSTASIKPEFFTIHNNKLYLNYSKSVFKKWSKDKEEYIEDANQEWPGLVDR